AESLGGGRWRDARGRVVNALEGSALDLGRFAGTATFVVNVASRCGLTPQYAGLSWTRSTPEVLFRSARSKALEPSAAGTTSRATAGNPTTVNSCSRSAAVCQVRRRWPAPSIAQTTARQARAPTHASAAPACVDNGLRTPAINDSRVDPFRKGEAIRQKYAG